VRKQILKEQVFKCLIIVLVQLPCYSNEQVALSAYQHDPDSQELIVIVTVIKSLHCNCAHSTLYLVFQHWSILLLLLVIQLAFSLIKFFIYFSPSLLNLIFIKFQNNSNNEIISQVIFPGALRTFVNCCKLYKSHPLPLLLLKFICVKMSCMCYNKERRIAGIVESELGSLYIYFLWTEEWCTRTFPWFMSLQP